MKPSHAQNAARGQARTEGQSAPSTARSRRQPPGTVRRRSAGPDSARGESGAEGISDAQGPGRRPSGAAPRSAGSLHPRVSRGPHAQPRVQHDLGRVLEILQVLVFHLGPEPFVLDHHVELAVADPAREVEVGRAHAGPARVGHRRLRVQHGPVPLEDADSGFEQGSVAGPRDRLHEGDVAAPARHQQADVDTVARRRAERLHVGARARVVGVGQPEGLAGEGRDQGVEPEEARGARGGGDHAQSDLALSARVRSAGRSSSAAEAGRRRPRCRRRPEPRPPPPGPEAPRPCRARGRDPAPGSPSHMLADTQARDEGHAAVHHHALPVVAAQPAQRLFEPRRVVAAHLDAGLAEPPPERREVFPSAAHPVVDDAHAHALASLCGQRRRRSARRPRLP